MATSIVRKKFFVCLYCAKVHELKHKGKSVKAMEAYLHDEGEEERVELFRVQQAKVVSLLQGRYGDAPEAKKRRLAANMIPNCSAEHIVAKSRARDAYSRRGKAMDCPQVPEDVPSP